ncbi:MAG: DUF5663 domain-containing protein [bacterium]
MSNFKDTNQNIIKVLGIDQLPQDKQAEAMERLGGIVYQEVMLRVLDTMSEPDKDEFEKLVEKTPDPESLFTYLASKVPDLDKIVAEEAESLRTEASDIMSDLGK